MLPDVRGLFHFYEELALRFAEEGITAIGIDYFGRTAGVGARDATFPFMEHVMQTRAESIRADVAAAVAYVRSPEGGACRSVFTVGFCFGGSNSWLQAAGGHGLSGVVGFYGRPGPGRDGSPGPLRRASEFRCPVLALMGGADQGIPAEQVDEFKAALLHVITCPVRNVPFVLILTSPRMGVADRVVTRRREAHVNSAIRGSRRPM